MWPLSGAVVFMPIPLPGKVPQTSCCTHLLLKDVLQTGLGMGMGMNGTAQWLCPTSLIIIVNIIMLLLIIKKPLTMNMVLISRSRRRFPLGDALTVSQAGPSFEFVEVNFELGKHSFELRPKLPNRCCLSSQKTLLSSFKISPSYVEDRLLSWDPFSASGSPGPLLRETPSYGQSPY